MKLSIIVTNYNYGRFLEEAITSLFHNTSCQNFEVLLVDDGSTDGSDKIITQLCRRFPRLKFYPHTKNQGQEAAFETAFPHVQGEYLHPFAADDVMLPGALDTMLDYFERFPEISCFCSDNTYFNHTSTTPTIEVSKLLDISDFQFFSPQVVYKLFSHTNFWVPGHTIFAKTKVFLHYTPLDKKLRFINDWWVNHRMALDEGIAYIPQAISAQRKHGASFGASPSYEAKRAVWLHLFHLLEEKPLEHRRLYKSGVFRMFGLKAIYKDLLTTPRYWKYSLPMIRKLIEQALVKNLGFKSDRYWLQQVALSETKNFRISL